MQITKKQIQFINLFFPLLVAWIINVTEIIKNRLGVIKILN